MSMIQVAIHTDTLNEAFVEATIAAFKGRTIHTYHTEGVAGTPDIIKVCGEANVLLLPPTPHDPTRSIG